jgi:hypothetical protein
MIATLGTTVVPNGAAQLRLAADAPLAFVARRFRASLHRACAGALLTSLMRRAAEGVLRWADEKHRDDLLRHRNQR